MSQTNAFITLGTLNQVRGLTERQRAARVGKLTASRVSCLMTGDAERINRLWLEMTGQAQENDLSSIWAVQLGIVTEHLNLEWAERKVGEQVIDRGVFIQHPHFDWAGATIDGMFRETERPIEAKHVGGHEPLEIIIDRYQPQLQWIMTCATWEPKEIALSVIFGANEPIIEWIPFDPDYSEEMVKRGDQFMRHVRDRTPPVELPPITPPVVPTKKCDMYGHNEWAMYAAEWLSAKPEMMRFKEADKALRELVPAYAKECIGYGIRAKRDRAGHISIREDHS